MINIITLLSGGTGTPKLLQGLTEIISPEEINVIVNTGEDVEQTGVKISPDIDTVVYTLADIIEDEKWYGIKNDTFETHKMLKKLGERELLRIGDKDRAIKTYRTLQMGKDKTLSEVTADICKKLGVKSTVLPMTNDEVSTQIITEDGEELQFHEYWVKRHGNEKVKEVNYLNSEKATPAPGVINSIEKSSKIIIGPSNPITSIGPILSIEKIRQKLKENQDKVITISPIIGNTPVSGPTGNLMRDLKREVTPVGVAKIYEEIMNTYFVHKNDEDMVAEIEKMGIEVELADILLDDITSKINLAKKIL